MPSDELDDCLQEVWTAVISRLSDFRHPGDRPRLRPWLYALVRSKAIDIVRSRTRHPTQSLQQVPRAQEPCDCGVDAIQTFDRRWKQAVVQAVLDELRKQVSERDYAVLHMRHIDGRMVQEVADSLGIKPPNVWTIQHRMEAKLRGLIKSHTGLDEVDFIDAAKS